MYFFCYEHHDATVTDEYDDITVILGLLKCLELNKITYCTLTIKDNYVQLAGKKNKLIIEKRIYKSDKTFNHYVYGKFFSKHKKTFVKYSGGKITLFDNEILTENDAVDIFEEFSKDKNSKLNYVLRDVTNDFN